MTTDRNCLDAETVAAWMDGGLDAASVVAAEAHASSCERCQALLATVASTLPVGTTHEARGTARFWKWWLAPIAATAAAVTLWMVVPQTPMQSPPATPLARDDVKAQAPAARADAPAPAASAPSPAEERAPGDSRRNVPAVTQESKALADADTASRNAAAGNRVDQQAKREEAAPLAAEMRQAMPAAAAPPVEVAAAERLREAPAAPVAPVATAAPAESQLRKQVAAPVIVSPDPNSRWRVTAPGTIERSEDGGRVWLPVRINAKEDVLAGASPSRLTCWLVGRNGLVLLATDGTNFTRLPFPASVDLLSVTSPEPRIATVTTADGRTFRTTDGGRTWRQ